ncbi:hypothetical protein MMC13_007539 [Lambiella insularis]|nr:hypothetical protein [Lambiella insularis]
MASPTSSSSPAQSQPDNSVPSSAANPSADDPQDDKAPVLASGSSQPDASAPPSAAHPSDPSPDANLDDDLDDEAPLLVSVPPSSDTYTHEHLLFVAFLKPHLAPEEIAFRLFATFPRLRTREAGNDHAKLADIEMWVGMQVSRWAPVQEASKEQVEEYSWGRGLVEEFGG